MQGVRHSIVVPLRNFDRFYYSAISFQSPSFLQLSEDLTYGGRKNIGYQRNDLLGIAGGLALS